MVKRIVLTGGPGSGKTTVIERIKKVYEEEGYKVLVVDETASYLINMGLRPFGTNQIPMIDFQELVMKFQLGKENVIKRAIDFLKDEKVIVIYDRGALDNRAYINEEEFNEVLSRLNDETSIQELMDRYDLIINLVSRKDFYTRDNNKARSEDADLALELGKKTLNAWLGHKNIKIVLPKDELENKIKEVLNIINEELNERKIKHQEKYLVTIDDKLLIDRPKKEIYQTYLSSPKDIEKRLRKVVFNDKTSYIYTVYKVLEDNKKRLVSEESVDKKTYEKLLEFKDETRKTIHKIRYYFALDGKYFQLDKYDDDTEILEVNIFEDEKVDIPSIFEVHKKVTNDESFTNKCLSLKLKGKELKKIN